MVHDDIAPPEKPKKFSINWPAELIERIDAIKEKTGVTRTAVILTACTQYVQMMEEYFDAEERGEIERGDVNSDDDLIVRLCNSPMFRDRIIDVLGDQLQPMIDRSVRLALDKIEEKRA